MGSLSENPVIFDPSKALSKGEQHALSAIAFYKRHRQGANSWQIGDKRVSQVIITRLQKKGLVTHAAKHRLDLTPIGEIARDRMEAPHGTA